MAAICACCCCLLCVVVVIVAILMALGIITLPVPPDAPFEKWAAVCDAPLCADAATEMFNKSGMVGDAAVAALLCMGVTAPHLTGLGGGLIALFYESSTQKVQALDSLGVSPAGVTASDMFAANVSALKHGANAFIVPGAIAGYKAIHTKVGRLPWKDLFAPAIRLAKNGFEIGPHLAEAIASNQQLLRKSPSLSSSLGIPFTHLQGLGKVGGGSISWDRFTIKATGAFLRKGDILVQAALGDLLEKLAENGPDILYKKQLADEIQKDVAAQGTGDS
ncbi:scoloptoxin SSD14-like [Haemaphysalis longicornis]